MHALSSNRAIAHVATLMLIGAITVNAEAGVSGNSYSGSLLDETGLSGTSCIAFSSSGSVTYDELFEGQPLETYAGTYREIDLVILSFWTAQFRDQTSDRVFDGQGISIFGLFVVGNFVNPDFSADWTGRYLPSNCTPAAPALRAEGGAPASGGGGGAGQ